MGTLGTGTVGTWGHLKTPGSVLGTGTHLGFRGQEGTLWGQEGTLWARGTPGPWGLSWGQKRDTLGPWGHCGDAVGSVPSRSGRRPGLVLPHPVQHLLSGHHAEPLRGEVRRGGAGPPPPPRGLPGVGRWLWGRVPALCPRVPAGSARRWGSAWPGWRPPCPWPSWSRGSMSSTPAPSTAPNRPASAPVSAPQPKKHPTPTPTPGPQPNPNPPP